MEDEVWANTRNWIRGGLSPHLTQSLQRMMIISDTSQSVIYNTTSNIITDTADVICCRNLHSGANFRTISAQFRKFCTNWICCCHPPEPVVGSAVVQPRLTWASGNIRSCGGLHSSHLYPGWSKLTMVTIFDLVLFNSMIISSVSSLHCNWADNLSYSLKTFQSR